MNQGILSASDLAEANVIREMQDTLTKILTPFTLIAVFLNVATPTASVYPIITINMLQYLKYIDVSYPPELQYILDSSLGLSVNIAPGLSDHLKAHVPNYPVPGRFGPI